MSAAAEVTERVDLSWADMDNGPVCSGIVLVVAGTGKRAVDEACGDAAVWSRTTHCCRTRTSVKCDTHKRAIVASPYWTCTVCLIRHRSQENIWRRL